jgi:hypothetical protein
MGLYASAMHLCERHLKALYQLAASSDSWELEAGSWKPEAGSRKLAAES